MPSSSDPTEALRAHLRGGRQGIDRHPLPEQLTAYHERRLSPGEADEVRAHLATCPDCTTQLLELAALLDEQDDPGSEISREEMDAAWQRQRARLFPDRPAALAPERSAGPPLRRAWRTAASLGLAAALLAVVALLQWRTISRLQQAQTNPPLVNLAPAGSVRRGAEAAPELRLAAQTQRAWVILNPVAERTAPSYEVELVAPDGRIALRLTGLQKSEASNFRLEIPRAVLTAGDYRVLLYGRSDGHRWISEKFDLRISLSPPSAP